MNTHVAIKTVGSTEIAFIPNGSNLVTPQIETYVIRYQTFLKKTAEAVLGLAQTLYEAKTNLNGVDFSIFCDEVGTPENGPTYHKLMKIADNVHRLTPFSHKLPNTWTTIYKLSKLSNEQFEHVSSNLTPFMTAKEIDVLVGKNMDVKSSADNYDLKLSFEDLNPEQKAKIYEQLEKLKSDFSFKINETIAFKNEMKALKTGKKS